MESFRGSVEGIYLQVQRFPPGAQGIHGFLVYSRIRHEGIHVSLGCVLLHRQGNDFLVSDRHGLQRESEVPILEGRFDNPIFQEWQEWMILS